jgi:endonuclease G
MMKRLFATLWLLPLIGFSQTEQDIESQLGQIKGQIDLNQRETKAVQATITDLKKKGDQLKLDFLHLELKKFGYPIGVESEQTKHKAMVISYNEKHEQANWVFHKILPDVAEGNFTRTNDFRVDSTISTLSSQQEDYFLVKKGVNGEKVYDGFGYDRGHLAPSADFRWNQEALSESYFYSNMAPQDPLLNREKWAELEGILRAYVIRTKHPLYVVTGPILNDSLPKIIRSVNEVSIPKQFFKAVYDPIDGQAMAFILSNDYCKKLIRNYAVSIDEVEKASGLNLFPNIKNQEAIEVKFEFKHWLPEGQKNDAQPLSASALPKNAVNTVDAKKFMKTGKKKTVCGTVVSTKKSKKGNTFLNLDKSFPNHIFSATIWKSNAINFSYEPHVYLMGKEVCIKGKIGDNQGIPTINIEKEEAIELLNSPE